MKVLHESDLERAQRIYRKLDEAKTREEYQDALKEQQIFMDGQSNGPGLGFIVAVTIGLVVVISCAIMAPSIVRFFEKVF